VKLLGSGYALGRQEMALLLGTCRSYSGPAAPLLGNLELAAIDWDALCRVATALGASRSLWLQLEEHAAGGLPPQAELLRKAAVWQELRTLHQRKVLERVVHELTGAGYQVVLLKGAVFLALEGEKARAMGDLDILVPGASQAAWQWLCARGWHTLSELHTAEVYASHHHLPALLDPAGSDVAVEIHRAVLPIAERLGLRERDFVERARPVKVGAATVLVPSPEHMLLHTALHFAWSDELSSGWWRAFADAHATVSQPDFSWQRFLEWTVGTAGAPACWWTLELAQRLTGLEVPAAVLRTLEPQGSPLAVRLLLRHFSAIVAGTNAQGLPTRWRRWLWELALKPDSSGLERIRPWQWSLPAIAAAAPKPSLGVRLGSLLDYLGALLTGRGRLSLVALQRESQKGSSQS
jgi:hypothetical protein